MNVSEQPCWTRRNTSASHANSRMFHLTILLPTSFCDRLSTTFVTRRDTSVCVKPYRMRHRLYHVPSWSGIYLPDNRIRCSSTRFRPPPRFRPRRLHLLWPRPQLQPKLQPLLLNVPLLPLIPLLLPHLPMRPMKAETLHLPLQQLGIIDHRNSLPITENRLLQGRLILIPL